MLKGVLAVSGYSGLYKKVAEGKTHFIVEQLLTKKRMSVQSSAKVSMLEDIAIFTGEGEKPLLDILKNIHVRENGGRTIDHKSSDRELKEFFAEVVPDYDREKVYISDIRKLVSWYNILFEAEMLVFPEEDGLVEEGGKPVEGEDQPSAGDTISEN